jgi:hypothetical protein
VACSAGPGFGTSGTSSFHLRRSNSFVYETPEIAQHPRQHPVLDQRGEYRHPRSTRGVDGHQVRQGPFYFSLAHEIHYDLFGGSQNAPAARRNTADQRFVRATMRRSSRWSTG